MRTDAGGRLLRVGDDRCMANDPGAARQRERGDCVMAIAKKGGPAATVDGYIGAFPKNVSDILKKMRQTIKKAAPEAKETISYGIPAYKLGGAYLIYFAAFKKHIGLFPPAPKAFEKETARYAGPKGNLKFPLDEAMPLELVRRIVGYKVREIHKDKH
jgi:uncharacterized protein YdhG (YjbR/CyaY superfamily)